MITVRFTRAIQQTAQGIAFLPLTAFTTEDPEIVQITEWVADELPFSTVLESQWLHNGAWWAQEQITPRTPRGHWRTTVQAPPDGFKPGNYEVRISMAGQLVVSESLVFSEP